MEVRRLIFVILSAQVSGELASIDEMRNLQLIECGIVNLPTGCFLAFLLMLFLLYN